MYKHRKIIDELLKEYGFIPTLYLRYFNFIKLVGGLDYSDTNNDQNINSTAFTQQTYSFSIYVEPRGTMIDIHLNTLLSILSNIGGLVSSLKIAIVICLYTLTANFYKASVTKKIKKEC